MQIILLILSSGLAILLSLNYQFLWFFSLIAILPLLHIIYNYNLKPYQNFLVGFVAGTIMLGGVMFWHWSILPLDWVGINSPFYEVVLLFYVWGLSSITGGLVGIWSLGLGYLKRNSWFDFLLAPALWVIAEFIRSIVVSILWYGDGAVIGPHWTIAFIGYALASSNFLLPFASIGGIYLLSYIVIVINVILYFILRDYVQKNSLKKYFQLLIILLVVIASFNIFFNITNRSENKTLKVAVVNTYQESFSRLSNTLLDKIIHNYKNLLLQIKDDNYNADIVIFPEDTRLLAGLTAIKDQLFIKEIFGDREVLIVDSARISTEVGKPVALTFNFLNTKTGQLYDSSKQFLIPHGEYMPWLSSMILKFVGRNDWVDSFHTTRGFQKGKKIQLVDFQGFKIGALACSEVMSVEFNRNLVAQGAGLIINTASHSLFHGSRILYNQSLDMGKVRALENNRYYIQSGNFVPSFIIDHQGHLISESKWGDNNIIYGEIEMQNKNSLYNTFGRFLLPMILLIILVVGLLKSEMVQKLDYFRKND